MKQAMNKFNAFAIKFHNDREAATIVEYAVMIALIVAVCFIGIRLVGFEAAGFWNNSAAEFGEQVATSLEKSNLK